MKTYNLLFAAGLALAPFSSILAAPPVLVELFTSFNCPACPAADQYAKGMVERNEALVLSYHVDYWNNGSFTDPFSHYDFTERQYDYSNVVSSRPGKVFTPQMVVDGTTEVAPPYPGKINTILKEAATKPKTPLRITRTGEGLQVTLPRHEGFVFPILWLVGYNNTKVVELTEGTHKGRRAVTVNTVMYLAELPYTGETAISLTKYQIPRTENVAVFLQEPGPGRVLALGTLKL